MSLFVAECVKTVTEQGLSYEVTSMGMEIEGAVDELLRLAARMHEIPFAKGAKRVITSIKIDERRDKEMRMTGKKEAVLKRLKGMKAEG